MKRTYLEEDLQLIKRHFPGAKPVALRTPFNLTPPSKRLLPLTEEFHDRPRRGWKGGVLWMN